MKKKTAMLYAYFIVFLFYSKSIIQRCGHFLKFLQAIASLLLQNITVTSAKQVI